MLIEILIGLFVIGLLAGALGITLNREAGYNRLNSFSVCVVAKNEEQNLPRLLASLEKINYPPELYELFLVDDSSTDQTLELFNQFAAKKKFVNIISLKQENKTLAGKKQGLQRALEKAKNEVFLLTDADCAVKDSWLRDVNRYWQNKTVMLAGYAPEDYESLIPESSPTQKVIYAFRRFGQLVSSGLFSSTIGLGVPFSCYGRNLAIDRKRLLSVGGYKSIGRESSGDDKQIMQLLKKLPGRIYYSPIKNVISLPELQNFNEQQKRKFGKLKMSSPAYIGATILLIGLLLYLPIWLCYADNRLWGFPLYLSALIAWIANLAKHREKFYAVDLLFVILYPYFMIYYTIIGSTGRWKWKA